MRVCVCVCQDQARAQAELLRRQEELEKKAAELDRRERELQSHGVAGQSASPLLALSPPILNPGLTVYQTQEVCVCGCTNQLLFSWFTQDVRTTGLRCRRSSLLAPVSTTTFPWTFP